jgi:hypothetical protein
VDQQATRRPGIQSGATIDSSCLKGSQGVTPFLKVTGAAIDDYENLERLTDYAVQFRYEFDLPPLALDRAEWNEKVKEFLNTVAFHLAG